MTRLSTRGALGSEPGLQWSDTGKLLVLYALTTQGRIGGIVTKSMFISRILGCFPRKYVYFYTRWGVRVPLSPLRLNTLRPLFVFSPMWRRCPVSQGECLSANFFLKYHRVFGRRSKHGADKREPQWTRTRPGSPR